MLKSAIKAIKEATKSEKSYVIFLADIKNFVADLVSELSTLTNIYSRRNNQYVCVCCCETDKKTDGQTYRCSNFVVFLGFDLGQVLRTSVDNNGDCA